VSRASDGIGDAPTPEQAEKLNEFLKEMYSPAITAHADQVRAMASDVFDTAVTMFIEGYEHVTKGDRVMGAFAAAKLYGWVQDLEPHARYQLITGLIKHMLDTTRSLKKPAVRGRRIDV
jgi:hypothetical protein